MAQRYDSHNKLVAESEETRGCGRHTTNAVTGQTDVVVGCSTIAITRTARHSSTRKPSDMNPCVIVNEVRRVPRRTTPMPLPDPQDTRFFTADFPNPESSASSPLVKVTRSLLRKLPWMDMFEKPTLSKDEDKATKLVLPPSQNNLPS